MTEVKVEIYGHFAELAGRNKAEVQIESPTVRGLLAKMKKTWSKRFIEAILDKESQEFSLSVVVLVNGSPVYHQQGLETGLKNGDKVIFIPPIAGG